MRATSPYVHDRDVVELHGAARAHPDRRHLVERGVAAAQPFLALEERDRDALATIAGQDQHAPGVLQARRAGAALDLGADLLDLLFVLRAAFLALECCYARVHRRSFRWLPVRRSYCTRSPPC